MLLCNRSAGRCVGVAMMLVIFASGDAWAQPQDPAVPAQSLRGRLQDFGARVATLSGIPAGSDAADETNVLAQLISMELATTPIGTSAGGFAFSFDTARGTFTRTTQGFGPTFAKRSLTTGRGTLSGGFNWLHAAYDSLGGFDLGNGELRFAVNARGVTPFAFPFGYASGRVNVTSDTTVAFVNYGVTDDLDISLAIPWLRVLIDLDYALFTSSNLDVTPGGHGFVLPRISDSGVGDIALSGKYRFWRQGEGGLAAELDMRIPSGNTNALRGTGVTRTLASVVYSHGGRVSPHGNVGFEVWSQAVALTSRGDVKVKDQIVYAFGLEAQATPRVTVLLDVIGKRQLKGGRLAYRTVGLGGGTIDLLQPVAGGVDVISAAPGMKWNVGGNVLLTANALLAMTSGGFRSNVIPAFGFDWTF